MNPGDLYAIVYKGINRVGTVRYSRDVLGIPHYNIYLEGWFLENPLIEDNRDDVYMGETSNYQLWFAIRSYGPVEIHPI